MSLKDTGGMQYYLMRPGGLAKSTSPDTENHDKNGNVINKNFIMTNVDINNDTKYTINENDTNNHNAHDLHKCAQQRAVSCLSCLDDVS